MEPESKRQPDPETGEAPRAEYDSNLANQSSSSRALALTTGQLELDRRGPPYSGCPQDPSRETTDMSLELRPATPGDAEICGQICFDAFGAIADEHNFPPDWPSPAAAAGFISSCLEHPQFYGVVAELDGRVVGSNFLDERASVSGLGPITVTPEVQDSSIGRRLMKHALDRVAEAGAPGVRLVQVAYHNRSLCLYAKLGFEAREMLSCMQGTPPGVQVSGYEVRAAREEDIEACSELCRRVHGFDRGVELSDGIRIGRGILAEFADLKPIRAVRGSDLG